jgi:phosphoribosyl 1,2-cyclic phosphodiesterase
MEITFWGTRGSIAAPGTDTVIYGGNTTCVEVTLNSGRTVVIDAGTGMLALGDYLMQRKRPLDIHLLITHVHWDHLMGFPFFDPLFQRDTRIVVDGWRRCMEGLHRVLSKNYMDGTWPLRFDDLKARIERSEGLDEGRIVLDDTVIESHPLQHPQGGLGFKFKEESGVLVFLTDNELLDKGWKGSCFDNFVTFCRDADLLVHDCQYLPEEMNIRRGWGHSDLDSVARLAAEAQVKRLILFHHDPRRKDKDVDNVVIRCERRLEEMGRSIPVDGAREGATIRI